MGEAPASEEDGPHGLASAGLRQGVADVPKGGRHSLQRPQDTLAKNKQHFITGFVGTVEKGAGLTTDIDI